MPMPVLVGPALQWDVSRSSAGPSLGPFVSSKIGDKELISLGEMCPASKNVTASEIGVCRKG